MTIHNLKIVDPFFDAVREGIKTFEVRKDDRDFKVGDGLILSQWMDEGNGRGQYSGEAVSAIVRYILRPNECPAPIPEGYCIMAIEVDG